MLVLPQNREEVEARARTRVLSAEAATDTALDRYQGIYGLGDGDKNRVPADLEEVFSGVGG